MGGLRTRSTLTERLLAVGIFFRRRNAEERHGGAGVPSPKGEAVRWGGAGEEEAARGEHFVREGDEVVEGSWARREGSRPSPI